MILTIDHRKLQNYQEELKQARDEIHRLKHQHANDECANRMLIEEIERMKNSVVNQSLTTEINKARCKKCGGKMVAGKATEQTWTGIPDFPGDMHAVTVSPSGSGRMVDCLKCELCGWSVSA